ncbi:MAG: alpha/beta hydrolase [Alphaproteobacteria bacterium]|nr:alpha/beta hydrolase [Alphaproteobacteria bacterium]
MTLLRVSAFAALASLLSACSPLYALDLLVPDSGYKLVEAIAYGPGPRRKLDLYVPVSAPGRPVPVVVFFYGGSWKNGKRGHYRFVGQALASRGIAVAVADYRLYPQVRFPAFVEDGARAVAAVVARTAEHGLDPERVFLMGHSAGAHLAALLALDARYLRTAGLSQRAIAGWIGLAGPYAFDPLAYDASRPVFASAADDIDRARPITHVSASAPPALLLHGTADKTVVPDNTEALAAALRKRRVKAETNLYSGVGHVGIIVAAASPFQDHAPVISDILRFVGAAPEPSKLQRSAQRGPAQPRFAR